MIADIEELSFALSMMCRDEVADNLRKVVFICHLQSFSHMTDNDLGTLNVCQSLVWVNARLVFRIIDRVSQFTDVVV